MGNSTKENTNRSTNNKQLIDGSDVAGSEFTDLLIRGQKIQPN